MNTYTRYLATHKNIDLTNSVKTFLVRFIFVGLSLAGKLEQFTTER